MSAITTGTQQIADPNGIALGKAFYRVRLL
jgi:hypothetical protein